MGALAGPLGGGGGASLQASSSASAGPQSGETGNLVLDFGGINLGNQDLPLNAASTSATNQTPTLGTVPGASAVSGLASYLPYILLAGALIALVAWVRKK